MNYSDLGLTIKERIQRLVDIINNPEVEPETRRMNLEILFREVGKAIYDKIFDMNAWDFDVPDAQGDGIPDQMYYGMAKIASDSVSTGGIVMVASQIDAFIKTSIALAQRDALQIAQDSNKGPQLKRTLHGKTCEWCRERSTNGGWISDPDATYFARHRACDCKIETRGYRSRNGELKNYVKPKDR